MTVPHFDPVIEPGLWLHRTTEPRRSKLGGLPNLPASVAWPVRYVGADAMAATLPGRIPAAMRGPLGRVGAAAVNALLAKDLPPLHFLGQIDLSELPAFPLEPGGPTLPASGYLFFFADLASDYPADALFDGSWMENGEDFGTDTRVIYAQEAGPDRKPPKGLPALPCDPTPLRTGVFPSRSLAAKRVPTGGSWTIPNDVQDRNKIAGIERDWLARTLDVDVPVVSPDDDPDRYPVAMIEGATTFEDGTVVQWRDVRCVRHQMFGVAPSVQNEPASTRHATDEPYGPAIPLMTFDTDWGVSRAFMFCDVGILQFWIRPKDLKARRFDRCFATTEGG